MDAKAKTVLTILENAGFEARIAGGAVRDYLLGLDPKDIDIATTALPVDVIQTFEAFGYTVVPTGLQHGTVTVMMDKVPFEITTLRIDKETDGRHAEVEFVTNFKLDAARRDFTFNAMFMDVDGKIYDYFGGEADLKAGVVRFVGDAKDRIEEDYLRIMRYFRFLGRMKTVNYDQCTLETLKTIQKMAHGLDKISGERIWVELTKILSQPRAATIVRLMAGAVGPQLGIRDSFFPDVRDFNNTKNWLLKLIAMFDFNERVISVMKERFKANSNEIEYVKTYFLLNNSMVTDYDIIERCAKNDYFCSTVFHMTRLKIGRNWKKFDAFFRMDFPGRIAEYEIMNWPINADDLMAEGFKPGPELGKELKKRRSEWLDNLMELL